MGEQLIAAYPSIFRTWLGREMGQPTMRGIEVCRPKAVEYKVIVDRGLHLRIAPDGRKTWLVRYVVDGKQIQARLPLPYRNSGGGFMSLADAASENVRIQALARDNVDFQSERAEREVAAAARFARTAEDTLAAIRQMFRWACKRQPWHSMLVDGNLADLVEPRHFVPQA